MTNGRSLTALLLPEPAEEAVDDNDDEYAVLPTPEPLEFFTVIDLPTVQQFASLLPEVSVPLQASTVQAYVSYLAEEARDKVFAAEDDVVAAVDVVGSEIDMEPETFQSVAPIKYVQWKETLIFNQNLPVVIWNPTRHITFWIA